MRESHAPRCSKMLEVASRSALNMNLFSGRNCNSFNANTLRAVCILKQNREDESWGIIGCLIVHITSGSRQIKIRAWPLSQLFSCHLQTSQRRRHDQLGGGDGRCCKLRATDCQHLPMWKAMFQRGTSFLRQIDFTLTLHAKRYDRTARNFHEASL